MDRDDVDDLVFGELAAIKRMLRLVMEKFGIDEEGEDEVIQGHMAIHNNDLAKFKFLNEKHKDLFKKEFNSFLVRAANRRRVGFVKYLLEIGADPSPLKGTSAYSNFEDVEKMFDEHLKTK